MLRAWLVVVAAVVVAEAGTFCGNIGDRPSGRHRALVGSGTAGCKIV